MRRQAVMMALVWLLSGCGSSSPVAPSDATLNGIWTGTVEESYGGRGTLRMAISHVAFGLSGEFAFQFPDAMRSRSGLVVGTTGGVDFEPSMHLVADGGIECPPDEPRQTHLFFDWLHDGDRLAGTYQGFGCAGSITGTFELKRERKIGSGDGWPTSP